MIFIFSLKISYFVRLIDLRTSALGGRGVIWRVIYLSLVCIGVFIQFNMEIRWNYQSWGKFCEKSGNDFLLGLQLCDLCD